MLTHGLLTPHPPAIIPAVGGASAKQFEKTIGALLELSFRLKKNPPATIVILSPHGQTRPGAFTIRVPREVEFTASFAEFGAPGSVKTYPRDRLLTAQIIEAVTGVGLAIETTIDAALDFGASVPLYYLAAALPAVEVVSLGTSLAGAQAHAQLGKIIRAVADENEKPIALVASAEFSHKLTKSSPHGFHPAARAWEEELVRNLVGGDFATLLNADPFLRDEVGECGYRALATLLGAFADTPAKFKLLSHEAPTGIGLLTGFFGVG